MKKIFSLLCLAAMALCATAQDESDISPLALGLQGGVGYMTTVGSINDYLGGGASFTAGVTADYKRLRLKADVSFCQPKINNRNPFGVKDESGRDIQLSANSNASQTSLGLQLGYKVYDRGRISVTPSAGMFYTHFGYGLSDVEWKTDEHGVEYCIVTDSRDVAMNNTSWMASVDVDIRLGERNTTEPFFLNQRYSRLSTFLRITPWVAGGKVKLVEPGVNGVYVGATVRLTGFMRSLGF